MKYSNGVGVGKWRDKREVLFISTEFDGELANAVTRREEEKLKPNAIIQYNKNMSGIYRQYQILSYYGSDRKTIRWYKKIAIHFISIMLLDVFHLYNMYSTKKKLNYYDFRHCIIKNFLSKANNQ